MNEQKPDIQPGDKTLRLNLALLLAGYVLLAMLLEPLIDFFLTRQGIDPYAALALAEDKQRITGYVYSLWRMLPMLFFLWLGWRVIASLRMPPAGMKSPFTVRVLKGKQARMFGLLLIMVALLLLYRELVIIVGFLSGSV